MARITREYAVAELAEIARDMLRKYHEAESTVIAEYSIDSDSDDRELDAECDRVYARIGYLEGMCD